MAAIDLRIEFDPYDGRTLEDAAGRILERIEEAEEVSRVRVLAGFDDPKPPANASGYAFNITHADG